MIVTTITAEQQEDWGLAEDHKALIDELITKINELESRIAVLEGTASPAK